MVFLKVRLLFSFLIGLAVAGEALALGETREIRIRAKSIEEVMSPEGDYKAVVERDKSLIVTNVVTSKTVIDFGARAKGVYFLSEYFMVVFYAGWLGDQPTSFAVYNLHEKRFEINKVECIEPLFMAKTSLKEGRYLELSFFLKPGSFSRYDLENNCWACHSSDLAELHAQREARHKIYRVLGWGALAMGIGLLLKRI